MDTTAAAELGMMGAPGGGAMDGLGFEEAAGGLDLDQWADDAEYELDNDSSSWGRGGYGGAPSSEPQGFGKWRGRPPPSALSGAEPAEKKLRTTDDGDHHHHHHQHQHHQNHQNQSNGGPSSSGGRGGSGGAFPLGKANSSGGESFGPGYNSPIGAPGSGAGAVGRGRGSGSIFYKTKLCSRFRSGNCPYNTNCNFAHGMEELRKPPPGWEEFVASQELPPPLPSQSPSQGGSGAQGGSTDSQVRFHKTRPCKKYFGEGNCPYGEKCNFLHDEQSVPRAVREAREAAVAAAAAAVVSAASPKLLEIPTSSNGNLKEAGSSTPPASGNSSMVRPSNWKTRLCNKWETTGHCPFGDKCHFAHGSDELQRYGGGQLDSTAPAPAISEPKSSGTSSKDAGGGNQRHQRGASLSGKDGSKGSSSWRGPTEISTIYGDWIDEEYFDSGLTSSGYEGFENDAQEQRHPPSSLSLPIMPSPNPQTGAIFRCTNGLEQNSIHRNGFTRTPQDKGVNLQSLHNEAVYGVGKEGKFESMSDPEQGWGCDL